MAKNVKVEKCPLCGRVFTGPHADGALRLHLLKGHGAAIGGGKAGEDPPDPKVEKDKKDLKWRWLDKRRDPREAAAIADGYLEICDETLEVR